MYEIIDPNSPEEQKKYQEVLDKITPEMLGLKPTNDFARYAQQTIIDDDPQKAKEWVKKGAIGVMEAGRQYADEFNDEGEFLGNYNNVVSEYTGWQKSGQRFIKSVGDKIENSIGKIYDFKKSTDEQIKSPVKSPNLPVDIKNTDNKSAPYNRDDLTKKIGFLEGLGNGILSGEAVPFFGGMIKGAMQKKYRTIADKIKNGQEITQAELNSFNHYREKQYEKAIRGYTIGGQIGEALLPSLLAFGSEMALGGAALKGLKLAGKGVSAGTKFGKNLLRSGKVNKKAAKAIAFTTGQLAEGAVTAGVTSLVNPGRIFATYQERRLNDEMKITDRGTVIFSQSTESPAKAFIKSLGQVYISYFAENMGALLGAPLKAGGKAVRNIGAQQFAKVIEKNPTLEKLIQRTAPIFAKAYERLNNLPIKGKSVEWLKGQVKFDGFIEELGEEVLEDILNLTIGTENEERTLENYVSKIVKTPEEWAVLTGVIALQGTALSIAGNTLGNYMHTNGVEFENIAKVLTESTETEKIEYIDEAIKRGDIKINEGAIQDNQGLATNLKNKYYTQFKNANVDDSLALETAGLHAHMVSSFSKTFNISLEDADRQLKFEIQTLTDEQAKAQLQADTKAQQENFEKHNQPLYQSAMKRSEFTSFKDFYNVVLNNKQAKEKRQYNHLTDDGINIRIPHDTVIHDDNRHKLTADEWQELLDNIDGVSNAALSKQKSSYDGKSVLLKINTKNNTYGVVLETFAKNNPLISTAFIDTEQNIDNWIKNEAIPSGTKTSFLGIRLNSIISYIQPKFKSKIINPNIYFQSAYHGTPYRFDEFSLEHIGTGEGAQAHGWGLYFAENKDISENYRKNLTGDEFDNEQYFYNDNLIEDRNKKAILATIERNGIDKVIQVREKNLEKYKYDKAEYQTKKAELEWIKTLDKNKIQKKTDKGQLFKVDIPESDVLLDEDKHLQQQNKNVKNILYEMDKEFNHELLAIGNDLSGYGIYKTLSRLTGSDRAASEKLNEYGIKGITYDGAQDGRCYVIFDDKTIDILKVYYQSDSIKPIELQKDSVPNFEKVADLKNWIEENLNLLGDVQIKSNNRTVHFSKSNISRSLKGVNRNEAKRNSYAILKELVENSVYGYTKEADERHKERNKGQELYHNAFIYNGEVYGIEISVDIPKSDNSPSVYAGHKIKIMKKAPEVSEVSSDEGLLDLTGANISINDIRAIFNPDIKVYYQDNNLENKRGFTYQRFNFDGTTKDNLVVLLKGKADKSTILHELGHVYLTALNNLALENQKAKELLIKVNKFLNYNGVEYTTAQHEKFANSFVAYIRTGRAPTYGLKRVFENFKKWLNDLYSNLQLSDEIELSQEAKEIFDELLGDMTLEKQKKISLDIIQRAKDNALLRYFENEKNNPNISQNQLTDRQRRYRDTAYDVIWYALSRTKNEEGKQLVKDKKQLYMLLGNNSKVSEKNKGVMSQSEKLRLILSELDDPYSANDGFLPEWGEFFNDPASYGGSDSELALSALDVIEKKKYLYDSENKYEELSAKDVEIAELELDYILDKYAEDKTDKSNVVVAFFEWIDNQHPYIQEDLIAKWELKTNEIDRYQALNKFEQAKEDLKLYAAKLKGHGDYSSQFAQYAAAILKRLDFMTERDKEKIFSKLKEYNSFREIERNLDYVMDYAQTLDDVTLRRNIADTIINEIKHTTPEIKNGTKKTRYDYRTNKFFERLRYLNKLKQEEITDLYDAYVNGEMERRAAQFDENGTISEKAETYLEDIENSFLQFRANGMYYNSTEMLQTLLEKIQNAKFTGKLARDEMDFERRMEQRNWIDNCALAVESHRGKVGKTEELYSMEANLDSLLSMVFDDKVKNKFSLDDLYAQVDGRVGKDREEVLNKIAEVFGFQGILKGAMLNNKFIEMTNDKFTIRQRYANKYETDSLEVWNWEEITLSRMEVLYYYIQSKNPTSYAMLTDMGDENSAPKGQFDKFEFDELINKLTDQEKLMGDILQTAAEKYYNDLNKYHIKKHHIDMGKVTCYFPRKSEMKEVNELDLFNQYTEKSTNPKFVKMRSAGPSVRISPANPINVLFNHIQKANTIIIMGEQLDLMNKVFRDNDLKQKIKSVFGDKVYMEFMQHVTANLYDGQTATLSNAEGIISKLMSNIIAAPMLIKPQIGIKQVMGLINYGVGDEHVSTLEWIKAFGQVIKNPKAAIDFMMRDEYLKDRLTRANLNEAMKNQVDNKLFSKMSLLTDYFSLNMRLGDLFNLTLGGRAYVQVLLDKGYTEKQAFELFRKKTISDQQSSIPSTLSNLQRNSKNNPFARLLFAYQNTPHQYFRICANAVIKAKQGKMSKAQAIKTIFIYWWFLPFIFNMAGSLSPITFLTTGDPDEIFSDMIISCMGSISCIPFFGEIARGIFYTVTGQEYFGSKDWFTRANESIVKPIKKMKKGDLTISDLLKSLEVLAQGFGVPLEEINTQIEAIGDYAQGDYAEGFLKTLGYSRYRAKKIAEPK